MQNKKFKIESDITLFNYSEKCTYILIYVVVTLLKNVSQCEKY